MEAKFFPESTPITISVISQVEYEDINSGIIY